MKILTRLYSSMFAESMVGMTYLPLNLGFEIDFRNTLNNSYIEDSHFCS